MGSLVVLVLVGTVLAVAGVLKIAAVPAMRDRAAHLGFTVPSYRAIGVLEVLGVGALGWGRHTSDVLEVVAAAALLALMAGAVVAHLRAGDGPAEAAPAVVVGALLALLLALGLGS